MSRFHFERPDGIQGSPQNILIHLNEFVPPQGFGGAGVPTFNDETYVISGDRGSVAYVIGGQRGKVDYEVNIPFE